MVMPMAAAGCRSRSRSCSRLAVVAVLLSLAGAIVVTGGSIGMADTSKRSSSRPSLVASLLAGVQPNTVAVARRRLVGPGSSPPTCRARCGRCAPCQPVHVAIQPGVGAQWEYYPEVWRCKCRNKLYMP